MKRCRWIRKEKSGSGRGAIKRISLTAVSAALVICFALPAMAEEAQEVKLKIDRVALFKNGLGYFSSTGKLPRKVTSVNFGQLPIPTLGTFWVGYSKNVALRGLFTSMDEVTELVPASDVAQVLSANIGKRVEITIGERAVEGTVLAVTQAPAPEPPSPYVMDVRPPDGRRRRPYAGTSLQVVIIKTRMGVVTLNARSITLADIEGEDVKTSIPVRVRRPRIRMELEKEAGGEKVGLSYLARGITWSASYIIDLSDPKKAKFTAKALVINEVADLEAVHLDLVTGFPHIQFGHINSPQAMSQNLAEFLNALQQRPGDLARGRGIASNIMMQQAVSFDEYGVMPGGAPMPGYSTAAEGTVAEDLFYYPVEKFTLKRGETAYLPLFTAEVPYEHIYVWKIGDSLDTRDRYQGRRQEEDEGLAEKVWHCCRLTNDMDMPWTTAPAEFVKDGRFIGQDTCRYTAAGTRATVRINRAMNIIVDKAETEIERKRNAGNFYGYSYDLVKVKGQLKLKSRLDRVANVEVTKELSGEVKETTPPAKDIPTAKGLKRVNPRHTLVWQIELKKGEEKTLTYIYEVYVRK